MDSFIRSRHGYREKKISVSDRPSSSLWDAVPKPRRSSGDWWKLVAAVLLTVFAAVLILRGETIQAVRQLLSKSPPAAR